MSLTPLDVLRLYVGLHRFGIDHHQQHDLIVGKVEINHPHAAALAFSRAAPAHLACPVRARNDVACTWIVGNPVDECFALRIAPYCLRLFLNAAVSTTVCILDCTPIKSRQMPASGVSRNGCGQISQLPSGPDVSSCGGWFRGRRNRSSPCIRRTRRPMGFGSSSRRKKMLESYKNRYDQNFKDYPPLRLIATDKA